MKSIYTLVIIAMSLNTMAQISVNSGNYPSFGDQVILDTDTSVSSYTIGSAGTSQTYTFTSTDAHFSDTLEFMNPNTTPYASDFSSASMASMDRDSIFNYYTKSSTDYSRLGYNSVLPIIGEEVVVPFNDNELIANFPINYNDSWTDYSGFYVQIEVTTLPVDSGRMVRWVQKSVEVDGWGQVTTDYGTFDCLRQKVITNTWDTVWTGIDVPIVGMLWTQVQAGLTSDTTYEWISDHIDANYPLVIADVDVNGNILELDINRMPTVVSAGELSNPNLSIYPNPSSQWIWIDGLNVNENYKISILNLTGELVELRNIQGNDPLELKDLENGTYLISIENQSSEVIAFKRIILRN